MNQPTNSPFFASLPENAQTFLDWKWQAIAPYFDDLLFRPLSEENIEQWLLDWTRLSDLMIEAHARRSLAVSLNTTDAQAEAEFNAYLDEIYPASQAANQKLKEKLLSGGLNPSGFEVPLQKMRAESDLFCSENLPLLSQEHKLVSQYNKMVGAQSVNWEGEELTLQQLRRVNETPHRSIRESAWKLASVRQLEDRVGLNRLWV